MGSVHAKALGSRLAAVYDSDARKLTGDLSAVQGNLEGAGGRLDFSGVKAYRDTASLLADADLDAVDLCVPTDQHERLTVEALRAGKHVLVEKPIALDGESARRMIAAAEQSGRILMAAQVLRFMPEYIALRDALPRIGSVRSATFHRRCAAPGWGGWLLDPARSGGGAFDLLIHDVDLCLHLFGAPATISATGVDDAVDAQLFYKDGKVVVVTGGWERAGSYPFRMEYRVSGEGGAIEYSSTGRPPTLYAAEAEALPLASKTGYEAEIEYFLGCCATGKQPELCPPRESAQAVDLMRQVLEARSRNGEKIACNL